MDEGESDSEVTAAAPGSARARSGRWLIAGVVVAAVAALVATRLGDSDSPGAPGGGNERADGGTTTMIEADTTGEPALPDRPSTLTEEQLGGIRFVDVTTEAGLEVGHTDVELLGERSMTSGAAVADYDGDGWPDLYLTRVGRPNSLYRNQGDGTFVDVTDAAGVAGPDPAGSSGAAAFADIDGDGCVDLYVAGEGATEAVLYVNDCQGRFTDETAARGVTLPPTSADLGAQGHGVTFADYDADGDLDLLVLHWDPAFLGGHAAAAAVEAEPLPDSTCDRIAEIRKRGADRVDVAGPNRSRLFRNDGTGRFTDVTEAMGLRLDQIAAFTGEFVDVDGDGWQDLLIAGDFCTSTLYRNEGGQRFVDVTEASGVGTAENAMGAVVRDVDRDGDPDWFVTSIALETASGRCATRASNSGCSGNRLYLNRGDGTFEDATDDYGVRDGAWGWGAAIEDFGNDGRLEFAQTNGYLQTGAAYAKFATDTTRLWVPTGDGTHHEDGAALAGLHDDGVGHALVAFDYDGDGDLDLLVANYGAPPRLYRNDTPSDRRWLRIRLDDPTRPGNRQGVGARVVVRQGRRRETGWISTSGSYEAQKPAELHVGFGDDDEPARVEVWWPGTSTPQVVEGVELDQVLTVTRSPG